MNAIQAFDIERAKQVVEESPLIDWTIRGTKLVATIKLEGGLDYEVEVATHYDGAAIATWYIDVYWLESPPLRPSHHVVAADGCQFRKRFLNLRKPQYQGLSRLLNASVGEFLDDHSYSVCVAWDRELAEERAGDARDAEGVWA